MWTAEALFSDSLNAKQVHESILFQLRFYTHHAMTLEIFGMGFAGAVHTVVITLGPGP